MYSHIFVCVILFYLAVCYLVNLSFKRYLKFTDAGPDEERNEVLQI